MDNKSSQEQKYQKLASEYSKIRAQASVLKKAVIEEQNKNSSLRETLRVKETALRRVEQEVDSLGFRNKQLEHRVESLQDDLNTTEAMKKHKNNIKGGILKGNRNNSSENSNKFIENDDPVFTEEFQKKILENAQLTSLIADKESELILYKNRVTELEKQLTVRVSEYSETDKKLRKEIELLNVKNSELETKVAEAVSLLGSEDGLSVTGSDNTPIHNQSSTTGMTGNLQTSTTAEERIHKLEKDVNYWRTQFEILKINDNHHNDLFINNNRVLNNNHNLNSSNNNNNNNSSNNDSNLDLDIPKMDETKEKILYKYFNEKLEKIFYDKFLLESKITNYLCECELLQNNLEITHAELEKCENDLKESQIRLQNSEEDLATTRINYEEQISVLTEQVISLSDQLASLK